MGEKGVGGSVKGTVGQMYSDGRRFDWGGGHTMQYIDTISWTCTLQTYKIY